MDINNNIQEMLQSDNCISFIKNIYGNKPDFWSENHTLLNKMKFVINASTRMRYLNNENFSLQYKYNYYWLQGT